MKKRVVGIFCMVLAMCAVLIGRLIIIDTHGEYIAAAENHGSYRVTLATTRGKIYDRSGFALAGGASAFKALIMPSSHTSAELMKRLSPAEYRTLETKLKGTLPFAADVSDGSCECEGVTVFRVPKRYGDHSLAVHLVGRCGADGGESGIEYAYDEWLSNAEGELSVTCRVSASGRSLDGADRVISDTTSESDRGVMLTIDGDIQNIAETSAAKHIERGAVIVMNVQTGEINAMVSLPTYDRNNISAYLNDDNSPLINRAIAEYNAGSVFKPVIAAAALENGCDPEQIYECKGTVEIGGIKMGCINHTAHGQVNLSQAISRSCNTYFINASRITGADAVLQMAESLGFGKATRLGTHYSSSGGHLPERDKLNRPAELANLSFGQGSLTVTPVQIAGMISAIARGGEYIEPYAVTGLTDGNLNIISNQFIPERHRAMSKSTAKIIGECMRAAVTDGTAKAGATQKVTSAAKTGTAETGIYRNGRKISQAWYAGYFPYENPEYACVVLCEGGISGGSSAGPVFREIAERMTAAGYLW